MTKELLVQIIIIIDMWTTKLICLSDSIVLLDTVVDCKSNIIGEGWLDFTIHSFDYEIHSIEHFHLHTPFRGNSWIWVKWIKHIGWSQDSSFWVDFSDFLL